MFKSCANIFCSFSVIIALQCISSMAKASTVYSYQISTSYGLATGNNYTYSFVVTTNQSCNLIVCTGANVLSFSNYLFSSNTAPSWTALYPPSTSLDYFQFTYDPLSTNELNEVLFTDDSVVYQTPDRTQIAYWFTQFNFFGSPSSRSTYQLTVSQIRSPPPVPLPPAAWLFDSGLIGLLGIARRKKLT